MKKGEGYVDISISVGIFLIYIATIFIVFKPFAKADVAADNLLTIVRTELVKDAYWEIDKVPLFLKDSGTGTYQYTLANSFPYSWTEDKIILTDSNLNLLNFDLDSGSPATLSFDYNLINGDIIYVLHSDDLSSSPTAPSATSRNFPDFEFTFGAAESEIGLSSEKFNNLNSINQLKQDWSFPSSRDFKIIVTDPRAVNPNPPMTYNSEAEIPAESQTYVLSWSDALLNQDGSTEPIIITVQVW